MRPSLLSLICACSVWLMLPNPAVSQPQPVGHAEILWDRYGIPHIFAETEEDLFYGFGWAQAENHGNLLLTLYGQARGRAAEYFGNLTGFGGVSFVDIRRARTY